MKVSLSFSTMTMTSVAMIAFRARGAFAFHRVAVSSSSSTVVKQARHFGSSTTARFSSSTTEEKESYANPSRYTGDHPSNNIPDHIAALVGRGLHEKEDHPLGIINLKINEYFASLEGEKKYDFFLGEDPIVTTTQCFDDLRIPQEHPGRQPSDTYYISDTQLLRTHTSAHQSQHLRDGYEQFLCTGDVYRRDEIDASHYPAFHQLEGVKLFPKHESHSLTGDEWTQSEECTKIADDLKQTLEGLMDHLFGACEKKWSSDYFPFTEPSLECEILYNGEWLEVLGCGVIHTEVLDMSGRGDRRGWAFGLGLERLAMILFEIPDIRLFWTNDERFSKQFKAGQITKFKSYSKYPPCYKDIAFWLPEQGLEENDFFEVARGIAGDLIEKIDCTDEFTNPKTNKTSKCYRITYRSMDRSLTDDEINALQSDLREKAGSELDLEVR